MQDAKQNTPTWSKRKVNFHQRSQALAARRDEWIERNHSYYEQDYRYMRFLVPEGLRVLDLGCGTGRLLAELRPAYGVGIDISEEMIATARQNHPGLDFVVGDVEAAETLAQLQGPFDVIILSDIIGYLDDCEESLARLHALSTSETRIVIAYHNPLWAPVLGLATRFGQRMPMAEELNWLSSGDIASIIPLAGFDLVKREYRQLVPKHLFGLGPLINRFLAPLPILRTFCLRNYLVARDVRHATAAEPPLSTTVVIPCRNERGNIENAIRRLPQFCDDLEVIFVEGNSSDGTWEECLRVQAAYPDRKIKCFQQTGKGKGDAVRKGFDEAGGDVLMILDADLTVRPEDLPKFYRAIQDGRGEFINGSRLVYPMESEAMRFLNHIANWLFARIFSYLLNQRFTDTLCGTKVLTRKAYQQIVANRAYFGDFDPFGDFDLIFGAAKLNLKTIEVPIRYAAREYGETQISRFRHGLLLIRMVVFAFFKLKAL
ncbi:putative Glycosyl transferase, family 2 Dolichyl-phosphate beta-D-mannosyltransferase [Candidatus Terasakiella magnetica]|nr:putative Glycosyl transferase, family 2 Dolichyl-phosphate beta-D-mannosyltransferase [Candidatus Terasakiella magnetica]